MKGKMSQKYFMVILHKYIPFNTTYIFFVKKLDLWQNIDKQFSAKGFIINNVLSFLAGAFA